MEIRLRHAAIALALFGSIGLAMAQEVNPATAPDLKLSRDQKHTIYLSISNQQRKETAPPTFRAAVGAIVPPSVELQPLPKTIVDLMPQVKDYEYAMVANQVLLVEPKSKQVVDVITE
jgi:hypothetical protein